VKASLATVAALLWAWLAVGCAKQQVVCSLADYSGCMVDEIQVLGNEQIDDDEILPRIATSETGSVLEGVPIAGVIDALTLQYERFDRFVLERDLARVERFYRARGFYDAVVRAGRVRRIDAHEQKNEVKNVRLLVEILVEEGEPVRLARTNLVWNDWDASRVSEADAGAAAESAKASLELGEPFREDRHEATRRKIQDALSDLGFAYAKVESGADVDVVAHAASATYTITLGPRCTFGAIELIGLGPIPEWQVRPALGMRAGERYSTAKLRDDETTLADLGVFGSIGLEPVLSTAEPRATAVPIRIRVQPAALGSVRLGGGVELGDQVAVRGLASWQHKNATRALDRFAIEARPRLVLFPWRISTFFASEPFPVPEVAVRAQYTLPFPFDPKTNLFVQSQASIGLVTNTDFPPELTDETEVRGEYLLEHRQGAERRFFGSRLRLSLSHNLTFSSPFSYQFDKPLSDEVDSLLLSMLQLTTVLDLRKGEDGRWDASRPVSGVVAAVTAELTGVFLGGDVDDVKLRPELRFFAPLAKRVVLAGKLGMGFLFSQSYGFVLDERISEADVVGTGSDATALRRRVNRDVQILEKRGLFAGGPSSNRGYNFNQIAPHRSVNNSGEPLGISPDAIGGRTLWEGSIELRFPVVDPLGGVVFVDAADVTRGIGDIRFDHPHLASGVGIRYDTPIGPLRVDLGFKIPYLQVVGEEDPVDCASGGLAQGADPCALVQDEVPRDPLALSIAIGNAF
jgi:outer membrane protein insertion porin family/translocation and assembly module TamA